MEKKEEEETGMKEDFYSTFRGELLLSVVKETGNRSHFIKPCYFLSGWLTISVLHGSRLARRVTDGLLY